MFLNHLCDNIFCKFVNPLYRFPNFCILLDSAPINAKVIPIAAYPMKVCKFNSGELKELDQVIKGELRSKNMLGKQSSNERLYFRSLEEELNC